MAPTDRRPVTLLDLWRYELDHPEVAAELEDAIRGIVASSDRIARGRATIDPPRANRCHGGDPDAQTGPLGALW